MTGLPKRAPDTVTVLAEDGIACVTFPSRLTAGQDALIVVAKVTVSWGLDGISRIAEQAPLPTGDEPFEPDDEHSSLRYPNDFEPFKPRADVLVVANAYRQKHASVTVAGFRFGELRRSLVVCGDRTWQNGLPSAPAPFESLPLRWERAFGGPGHPSNPVGRGYADGNSGLRLPNLEREDQLIRMERDRPEPTCFGPVRREWPTRRRRLGTYDEAWLKERWPYYPRDFDWGSCNAAPPEQQLPYPRGDEPFEFYALRPEGPVVSGALPGRVPRVLAQFGKAEKFRQQEVALVLDTVWFDVEALSASLVFRGHLPVSSDTAPEVELLFACLNRVDDPLTTRALREKLALRLATLGPSEPPAPRSLSRGLGFGRSIFGFQEAAGLEPPPPSLDPGSDVPFPSLSPALSRDAVVALAKSSESLDGRDLSRCDLSGLDFRKRSLEGADLTGANLEGALFSGAHLERAKLSSARAGRASFFEARLSDADFAGADLEEADFTRAELSRASFEDVDAHGALFVGVAAPGASFVGANAQGAQFHSAALAGAQFSGAELEKANFESADLRDAQFYDAQAKTARLYKAQLGNLRGDGANFSDGSFELADATGACLQRANLERANFSHATLDDAVLMKAKATESTFNRSNARRARFDGATLEKAKFGNANLLEANFAGALLTAAYFGGANLWQAEFWKAQLDGAVLEGAFLRGTKLSSG